MDTTTLSSVTFCCENEKKKLLQIFFLYVTTSIYFSSISESKFD